MHGNLQTISFYIMAFKKVAFLVTDKSLLEAFILAPTNPQYDNRVFID